VWLVIQLEAAFSAKVVMRLVVFSVSENRVQLLIPLTVLTLASVLQALSNLFLCANHAVTRDASTAPSIFVKLAPKDFTPLDQLVEPAFLIVKSAILEQLVRHVVLTTPRPTMVDNAKCSVLEELLESSVEVAQLFSVNGDVEFVSLVP